MSEHHVTVRFYAAAAEAAGTKEITLALDDDPMRLNELLEALPRTLPETGGDSTPSLSGVCGYSSFLINAVHATPDKAVLTHGDTLDILPPFAGG